LLAKSYLLYMSTKQTWTGNEKELGGQTGTKRKSVGVMAHQGPPLQ